MQQCIATVSLAGALPEKLEAIAAAGFDGLELFENDLLDYPGTAAEVRQRCADLGVDIALYQPFRDFEGGAREQLPSQLERAERTFDIVQTLGCTRMLVCSNTQADASGDSAQLIDDLRQLAERAERRGLQLGYEALAWGRQVNTYQQAWMLVREANHPALGLVLDSFHTLALNGDPQGIAEIPGNKIAFVQMADAPLKRMDVSQWSRHYRCFPGEGELDMVGFLQPILATGYRGPLSLEVFSDLQDSLPARVSAEQGLRALRQLQQQVRARG